MTPVRKGQGLKTPSAAGPATPAKPEGAKPSASTPAGSQPRPGARDVFDTAPAAGLPAQDVAEQPVVLASKDPIAAVSTSASPEAALALKRWAKEFGVAASSVNINGMSLDQWPTGGAATEPAPRPAAPGAQNGPLGEARYRDYATWYSANVEYAEPQVQRADDQSIKNAFLHWGWNKNVSNYVFELYTRLGPGYLQIFARAKELGVPIAADPTAAVEFIERSQPDGVDEHGVAVMRRMARAFGWNEASITLDGKTLNQWPGA